MMNTSQVVMQLKDMVGNGSILTTITGGSLIVWLFSNLKYILYTIKNFFITLISFNVHNMYEVDRNYFTTLRQSIFNDIISNSKCIWERELNLDFDNDVCRMREIDAFKRITYGFSIRIMYGSIVFVNRSIREGNTKNNAVTDLKVFFTTKKRFMRKFNEDISNRLNIESKKNEKSDKISIGYGDCGWSSLKFKRGLDTIFTNGDEHIKLYEDIQKFINNREIYKKLNYPYKYSALIYGVPGSGKSSTILAIASALNRHIEYINLSVVTLQDLLNKLNFNTERTLFVFEDVDALNTSMDSNRETAASRNSAPKKLNPPEPPPRNAKVGELEIPQDDPASDDNKLSTMSLSDLLNVTDGLLSSDGSILIFTTNHVEKLDPALLRAGRMNRMVEFKYLDGETANRMISKYLGFTVGGIKDEIKPAELQEEILNVMTGKSDRETLISKFTKETEK